MSCIVLFIIIVFINVTIARFQLSAVDLNRDGFVDVIASDSLRNYVSIHVSDALYELYEPIFSPIPLAAPSTATIPFDINNDGVPDLVLLSNELGTNASDLPLLLLLNDEHLQFQVWDGALHLTKTPNNAICFGDARSIFSAVSMSVCCLRIVRLAVSDPKLHG